MLLEFIAGLVFSLFLTGLLFWQLVRRLRLNRNKANTFAPFYLLPVALTALIAVIAVFLVYPRLKDVPHILADNYDIIETTVSDEMLSTNGLSIDKRHLHLSSRQLPPKGTEVRLYVTPYSNYVMRIDNLTSEATQTYR